MKKISHYVLLCVLGLLCFLQTGCLDRFDHSYDGTYVSTEFLYKKNQFVPINFFLNLKENDNQYSGNIVIDYNGEKMTFTITSGYIDEFNNLNLFFESLLVGDIFLLQQSKTESLTPIQQTIQTFFSKSSSSKVLKFKFNFNLFPMLEHAYSAIGSNSDESGILLFKKVSSKKINIEFETLTKQYFKSIAMSLDYISQYKSLEEMTTLLDFLKQHDIELPFTEEEIKKILTALEVRKDTQKKISQLLDTIFEKQFGKYLVLIEDDKPIFEQLKSHMTSIQKIKDIETKYNSTFFESNTDLFVETNFGSTIFSKDFSMSKKLTELLTIFNNLYSYKDFYNDIDSLILPMRKKHKYVELDAYKLSEDEFETIKNKHLAFMSLKKYTNLFNSYTAIYKLFDDHYEDFLNLSYFNQLKNGSYGFMDGLYSEYWNRVFMVDILTKLDLLDFSLRSSRYKHEYLGVDYLQFNFKSKNMDALEALLTVFDVDCNIKLLNGNDIVERKVTFKSLENETMFRASNYFFKSFITTGITIKKDATWDRVEKILNQEIVAAS